MAEGGVIISSLDDLLVCSICMEEYEDPRALPCLHTFCYKCLEQLNSKEILASSSDGKLSTYIGMLKCPNCLEEHPIPKDKGVAGFRKDFRINKIIEQQKEMDTKAQGKEGRKSSEVCSIHPDERLLYHCENDSCKSDICEKCWAEYHDKHSVTLLSKKVNDAKEMLKTQLVKNMDQIAFQIEILSKTRKSIDEHQADVQSRMKKRFIVMQESLKAIFEKSCEQLEKQMKLQEEKLLGEIGSVSDMKNTLQTLQNNLEDAKTSQSSKTASEYEKKYQEMKQLGTDLEQWTFSYCYPQLQSDAVVQQNKTFDEIIQSAMNIFPKENYVGKEPSTGGIKMESKPARSANSPEAIQEATSEPQDTSRRTPRTLKFNLAFRTRATITAMAAVRNNGFYVASNDYLMYYKVEQQATKVFEKKLQESVHAMAIAADLLVLLNVKNRKLRLLPTTGVQILDYQLPQHPNKYLAAAENLIAYSFQEGNKVFIGLLSVDKTLLKVTSFRDPIEVPFGSPHIRSLCLSKSNRGNPVVVCSNYFFKGQTKKSETALVMTVVAKEISHSKMSFGILDSNARSFDLKSIVCDKDYLFVLNSSGNALYCITKIGYHVTKMNLVGSQFSLSSVSHIYRDPDSNSLYLAREKEYICKFNCD